MLLELLLWVRVGCGGVFGKLAPLTRIFSDAASSFGGRGLCMCVCRSACT